MAERGIHMSTILMSNAYEVNAGEFQTAASHCVHVLLYSILATAAAIFCFFRQMKKQ
jgi:hypothetical protein